MNSKNQKKPWLRFRHRVVRNLVYIVLAPYSRIKYGAKIEKFKAQEDRPYLILMNHQTSFDQFFVGMAFKGPVYYLATEDIFSKGWISSLIRYLVAPIPIKKQTTDIRAILNCIKVVKEGGTLALSPEGNRTYSGRTEYINPSIVSLAKKLNIPIALFRIEGGYGVQPRWSNVVRRGKIRAYVSKVISPEEFAEMSNDELYTAICDGLYVNEAVADATFKHKKSAEYLERAIYVCPHCGLSTFESHNDVIECMACHRRVRYLPTKELRGDGFDLPFKFVADWYDYQSNFVNSLNTDEYTDKPMYVEYADMYEVIPCVNKQLVAKDVKLTLYGDRLTADLGDRSMTFTFEDAGAFTVLGKNKLNIYYGEKIYQVKGSKRFNALKYVHIYHRAANIRNGDAHATFLGL